MLFIYVDVSLTLQLIRIRIRAFVLDIAISVFFCEFDHGLVMFCSHKFKIDRKFKRSGSAVLSKHLLLSEKRLFAL